MAKIMIKKNFGIILQLFTLSILMIFVSEAFAAADETWGTVAASITTTFEKIGLLITGGSYVAGLGFSIGAIMKFKQHKDNPSQTPVGTPIALVFISAALLFLPSVLESTGATMFGSNAKTATSAGCTMTSTGECA